MSVRPKIGFLVHERWDAQAEDYRYFNVENLLWQKKINKPYLDKQLTLTTSMSCDSFSFMDTRRTSLVFTTGLTSLLQLDKRSSYSLLASGLPDTKSGMNMSPINTNFDHIIPVLTKIKNSNVLNYKKNFTVKYVISFSKYFVKY